MTLAAFVVSSVIMAIAFRVATRGAGLSGMYWAAAGLGALVFVLAAVSLWQQLSAWTALALVLAIMTGSLAATGDGFGRLTNALNRQRLTIYLLSVFANLWLLFIAIPLSTYLSSPEELGIDIGYLLQTNGQLGVLALYLCVLLYALSPTSRMRTVLALLALWTLALVITYAFVLPFGYPLMSGLTFEQVDTGTARLALRAAADLVIASVLAAGVIWLVLRLSARRLALAVGLICLSVVGMAGAGAWRDTRTGAVTAGADEPGPRQPLSLSTAGNNVLILFLDRFMGSYVESILQDDPTLADRLSGFVWYPKTVSAGQNSIAGIHPMLGGYDYSPDAMNERRRSLAELSVEAFSILPYNFAKKGYDVNVVNPRGLGFTINGDCSLIKIEHVRCSHVPLSILADEASAARFPMREMAKAGYTDLLILLASMRVAPYTVKEAVYKRGSWEQFLVHSAGTTFREWATLRALPRLTATSDSRPAYNIISNILTHEPYYMGEDCRPRTERLRLDPSEVRRRGFSSLFDLQHSIAARCALHLVADYIDFLRKAGVYDNTRIIVVSDHGIVGPVLDRSERAVAGGTTANEFVRTRSVLLVKERNARGALRTSEDFLPNAEVPRIACEEIGGCVNPYLGSKPIVTAGRDDPFKVFIVPWQFEAQNPDSFVVKSTLELRGKDPFAAIGWVTVN